MVGQVMSKRSKPSSGGREGRVDTTKKSKQKKSGKSKSTADNWRMEARALGKEKKYQDIVITPAVAPDGGAAAVVQPGTALWNPTYGGGPTIVVNLVPQGEGITQRQGNAIKLKSLYISGVVRCPHNDTGNNESQLNTPATTVGAITVPKLVQGSNMRLAVVYDSDPRALDVAGLEDLRQQIFGSDINSGTQVRPGVTVAGSYSNKYAEGSLQNMRGQGRFHVLADERMFFPSAVVSANKMFADPNGQPTQLLIKRYIKLGGISTLFKTNSVPLSVGDIAKGALYCMWVTDNLGLSETQGYNPVFEGVIRLRYDE